MLIVQYPTQFSRPPRSISNHIHHRFLFANGGSTNTTRVAIHALFFRYELRTKEQKQNYNFKKIKSDLQNR